MRFFGKINPFSEAFRRGLREMSDAVDDYLLERDHIKTMAERPFPHVPEVFLARITGSREIQSSDGIETGTPGATDKSVNRWVYDWENLADDSRNSQNDTHFALNGAEWSNTNDFEEQSYGVLTQEASPKVELLSIGNLGETTPVVMMYRFAVPVTQSITLYESDGETTEGGVDIECQYFFSAGNDVKVTC